MTSLLRQIVAGPRARHPEADLDLCYVTSDIVATSGPSQTWPQRAYRNPLDKLVEFLDERHGEEWAIWEFRAEGTGYPDDEVYGRVRHYPWPDHHPPPFRLIPMIMASMRNWLHGGELHDQHPPRGHDGVSRRRTSSVSDCRGGGAKNRRVVVVHCKAGKGRSGTTACSYLIAERGWRPEEALTRFTERRMRPKFGAGVSIPSQLRTIAYVDRWTRHGKKYVDRPIEILEVHAWGLRDGVKVDVEGYADGGRRIHCFHTFGRDERVIIEGGPPEAGGMAEMMFDLAGIPVRTAEEAPGEAPYAESTNLDDPDGEAARAEAEERRRKVQEAQSERQRQQRQNPGLFRNPSKRLGNRTATLIQSAKDKGQSIARRSTTTTTAAEAPAPAQGQQQSAASSKSQLSGYYSTDEDKKEAEADAENEEPGGMAVILKPTAPIRIPNSDVNISVERRNRSSSSLGLTMVSAVAHVWFNAFFEGSGPENGGRAEESGVFSIDWDAMDGIKGSSRKGARALDRIAVVWRFAGGAPPRAKGDADAKKEGEEEEEAAVIKAREGAGAGAGATTTTTTPVDGPQLGDVVDEPAEGSPVPQMEAADWKGGNNEDPEKERILGLRKANPASADVSKASSVKSQEVGKDGKDGVVDGGETDSMEGVRVSGPAGEDGLDSISVTGRTAAAGDGAGEEEERAPPLPPRGEEPGPEILDNPDTADGTAAGGEARLEK